jgi:hypothetical protein
MVKNNRNVCSAATNGYEMLLYFLNVHFYVLWLHYISLSLTVSHTFLRSVEWNLWDFSFFTLKALKGSFFYSFFSIMRARFGDDYNMSFITSSKYVKRRKKEYLLALRQLGFYNNFFFTFFTFWISLWGSNLYVDIILCCCSMLDVSM